MTNYGGTVNFIGTLFAGNILLGNQKDRGVVLVKFGGTISVEQSCFIGNTGESLGSVYLDEISILQSNKENVGILTNGDKTCFYKQTNGAPRVQCMDSSAWKCRAQDPMGSLTSSFDPEEFASGCLTSWEDLFKKIYMLSDRSSDELLILTICKDVFFDLDSTDNSKIPQIIINQNNLMLRCGENGSIKNNCTIHGGFSHFKITGSAHGIKFVGLKFQYSTGVSIIAAGDNSANAEFKDCLWELNEGDGAILIYNDNNNSPYAPNVDITKLLEPADTSMTLSVVSSTFSRNIGSAGTILNLGGVLSLQRTTFSRNQADVSGVSVLYKGYLAIEYSCFTNNQGSFPGVIFIDVGAFLTSNKENYGKGNSIEIESCEMIFLEVSGMCVQREICEGICMPFLLENCLDSSQKLTPQTLDVSNPPSKKLILAPTSSGSTDESSKPGESGEPGEPGESGKSNEIEKPGVQEQDQVPSKKQMFIQYSVFVFGLILICIGLYCLLPFCSSKQKPKDTVIKLSRNDSRHGSLSNFSRGNESEEQDANNDEIQNNDNNMKDKISKATVAKATATHHNAMQQNNTSPVSTASTTITELEDKVNDEMGPLLP